MTSTLQIKYSSYGSHLLIILLIYFKIWKSVESINEPNVDRHNFEDFTHSKKSYLVNRIHSKYFKAIPRKVRMSPQYFSKSISSSFTKPKYVDLISNKNSETRGFSPNFYQKYKNLNSGSHKGNSNVDSSIISPGDFHRKYFLSAMRPQQNNNADLKFKVIPSQQVEMQNLKDDANEKLSNKLKNFKITTYRAHQKYFSSQNNSTDLSKNAKEDNHVGIPVTGNFEKSSKVLRALDNNSENQKLFHLEKKTIIMTWKNGGTKAEKRSRRVHEVFNTYQNKGQRSNPETRSKNGSRIIMNNENKEITTAQGFADKFRSFYNPEETFAHRNNVKYKNVNYEKSSTDVQSVENFHDKLYSFQDQGNSFNFGNNLKLPNMYLSGSSQNPVFRYSETTRRPENDENNHIAQKGTDFESRNAEQKPDWGIKTNISSHINIKENSVSIISKGNDQLHKSNQKDDIQLQIFRGFSRHDSVEPDHRELQAANLALYKQEGQTRISKQTVPLIVMALIILTVAILLLSCCAFLINEKGKKAVESTHKSPISQFFMRICRGMYCTTPDDIDETKYASLDNKHSAVEDDKHFKRAIKNSTLENINLEIYSKMLESPKSSKRKTFEEGKTRGFSDYQSNLKNGIRIDMQDIGTTDHSSGSDNLEDHDNACIKDDSLENEYSSSTPKDYIHHETENTNRSDSEYHQKYLEESEASESSVQKSSKEHVTEKRIGSPWNWLLKNVSTRPPSKETRHRANQSYSESRQDDSFSLNNQENTKHDYLKDDRIVKCPSPTYRRYHSENLEKPEADRRFENRQNISSAEESVHEYLYNINKNSLEQMENSSELNDSLKDRIGSPWHRNLINVKTKAISFHKIDTDENYNHYGVKRVNTLDIDFTFPIPSAEKAKGMPSTSDVPSVNKIHFNNSSSQYSINNGTFVTKDICNNPAMNTDSTAAKYIIETEQKISDSSEQSQYCKSTSSNYSDSNGS